MIKQLLSFVLVLSALVSSAQELAVEPQMADTFRTEGKIYVVIAVIGLIFISLIVFLVAQERRIKKIEDQLNKE